MRTVIGIDYGTQSARAVLIDAADGAVLLNSQYAYPHGVMPGDLASAADYDEGLTALLEAVTPPRWRDIVAAICVDATSLTLVPVNAAGDALCREADLSAHPQAQIKLWKRHAAQPQAEEALALARQTRQPFLARTGGSLSCEWTLPKLLEMRDEAPEVYRRMDAALDLCEYLTFRLTGRLTRSTGSMAFKGLWAEDLGFPDETYLDALRPGFGAEYRRLLRGPVLRPGDAAGHLTTEWQQRLHLGPDVIVASGVLDGHTALAALGAMEPGDVALVAGTSNVLTLQMEELREIEGVCGVARHGMVPGLYGVDAGQACTGDMLAWYVDNALPASVHREAEEQGISVHQLLCGRVSQPWANPVAAADWFNGSRNAPCDLTLPAALYGLTLQTRPEDIYLALLQGIACGARDILEQCAHYGIATRRVLATGGVTGKNPLLMQQYADLLGHDIQVGRCAEGPALGAAIFAAAAAGIHPTPMAAFTHMGVKDWVTYRPDEAHRQDYERLYRRNAALRQSIRQIKQQTEA